MSLSKEMRQDKSFRKLWKSSKDLDKDCEKWAEELMALHSSKALSALNIHGIMQSSQKISIDSNLDNYTIRSRAVTIRMKSFRIQATIERNVKNLQKLLLSRYAAEIKKEYKAITERRAFVEVVCNPMIEIVQNLSNVGKLAEMVIEDCDAGGRTLYNIGEILKLRAKDR